jgi:hypothetical protein
MTHDEALPTVKRSTAKCERLLVEHWDDETCTLHSAGIINSLGGEDDAADFFAFVLRSDLLGWRPYCALPLRNIVIKHLDPKTYWLGALWDYAKASVSSDPDEMTDFLKLIRMASSDHVRQWIARQLFSLCSSGTEAQRVFAFQGLETLIKAGGLVYVKKFAKRLEQIANTEPDPKFKLAAEAIRAFLYPSPKIAATHPIAPVSKQPSDSESRILTPFKALLKQPFFKDVDMVATELELNMIVNSLRGTKSQLARVICGEFAELFPEDLYPGSEYSFLNEWEEPVPLWVQVFGPKGDISQRERFSFATALENILALHGQMKNIETAAQLLLDCNSTYYSEANPQRRLEAAKAVLQFTRYTTRLMSASTFEDLVPSQEQVVDRHGLPHLDQRNLTFVPCSEAGKRWGGLVIFSHYPLSKDVASHALLMLKGTAFDLGRLELLTPSEDRRSYASKTELAAKGSST